MRLPRRQRRPAGDPGRPAPDQLAQPAGWQGAKPELAVAATLVASLAVAAWVIYGPVAASLVVLTSVALSLIALHALVITGGQPIDPAGQHSAPVDTAGFADPVDLASQSGWAGSAGPLGLEQIRLTHSFSGFWHTQSDLNAAIKSHGAWDYGTRPRLANLLAARLAERHGVDLFFDPDTARNLLLGAGSRHDLWYWIDPQRPSPPDAGRRPGIPPNVLAALIDRLEQL